MHKGCKVKILLDQFLSDQFVLKADGMGEIVGFCDVFPRHGHVLRVGYWGWLGEVG
jgi:hypothetical protein